MHPQALLVDASGLEEDYFLAGTRKQAPASGIPLIELPENAHSKLAWVTKLDSSSLAGIYQHQHAAISCLVCLANVECSLGQDQHRHTDPRTARILGQPRPSAQVVVGCRLLGRVSSALDHRTAA
jgi:hypothetical protein